MRTYELMYILDPRVSEEQLMSISTDVKELLTANGGRVLREEHWGRRKLAYEIEKLKEGKYILLYLAGEPDELNVQEVEYRMRQNDQILRYLTVRTDEELRRAGQPLPTESLPAAAGGEGEESEEGGEDEVGGEDQESAGDEDSGEDEEE